MYLAERLLQGRSSAPNWQGQCVVASLDSISADRLLSIPEQECSRSVARGTSATTGTRIQINRTPEAVRTIRYEADITATPETFPGTSLRGAILWGRVPVVALVPRATTGYILFIPAGMSGAPIWERE